MDNFRLFSDVPIVLIFGLGTAVDGAVLLGLGLTVAASPLLSELAEIGSYQS